MQARRRVWPYFLVLAGLAVISLGIIRPELLTRFAYAAQKGRLQAAREELARVPGAEEPAAALHELSRAFRLVVDMVGPGVVNIDTETRVGSLRQRLENLPEGLRERLEQHLPEGRLDLDAPPRREIGRGSGMIVDAEAGFILTNSHVVEGADRITVTLWDGRRRHAQVVSTDAMTDLAVVKIDADQLHQVVFEDSDELEVGDFVLAIGNPLGYRQSVSHGIVSAKGRNEALLDYSNFIQTDAAINPGNSGGPLVNLRGRVVGMNTAIATHTGLDSGIGFAIPTEQILTVLPYLLSGEEIVRGYLGLVIRSVREDREVAATFGWDQPYGVLLAADPLAGGPAERAGLRRGDIVLAIDGQRMDGAADLSDAIARAKPGSRVVMDLWRDQATHQVRVRVGKQPEGFSTRSYLQAPRSAPVQPEAAAVEIPELGLSVTTLDSDLAERHGWPDEPHGVVVTAVEADGPAADAGLRVGDLIVEVQRTEVVSATRFHRAVRQRLQEHDEVRVYVKRTPQQMTYMLLRVR